MDLMLDLPTIGSLCQTSQRFNNISSIEEFETNLRSQFDKIDDRDTVIVRVKSSDHRTTTPYNLYFLHKIVY